MNTKSHAINVENPKESIHVGYHSGTTTARDHNLYVKGNLVYEAKRVYKYMIDFDEKLILCE